MSEWDGHTERRQEQQTKLDQVFKVNLAIIFAFFLQVSGAIWWASTQTNEVKHLRNSVERIEVQLHQATQDRYTNKDANRDLMTTQKQIQSNTIAIQNNTNAIQRFYEQAFNTSN